MRSVASSSKPLHLGEETRKVFDMVVRELAHAVLTYDRSLRPDCQYEPIACWVNVTFTPEGKVSAVAPARRDKGPANAQCCLVYCNTYEDGATPYDGTWDGTVQDFHRDEEHEWDLHRQYRNGEKLFGFPESGCNDPSKYRFLKATLRMAAPDGDGLDYLPDYFHYAARDVATLKAYIRARRDEAEAEGGSYDPCIFEDVPFRLVLAKESGAEPYTGSWDNAPWEDA